MDHYNVLKAIELLFGNRLQLSVVIFVRLKMDLEKKKKIFRNALEKVKEKDNSFQKPYKDTKKGSLE